MTLRKLICGDPPKPCAEKSAPVKRVDDTRTWERGRFAVTAYKMGGKPTKIKIDRDYSDMNDNERWMVYGSTYVHLTAGNIRSLIETLESVESWMENNT